MEAIKDATIESFVKTVIGEQLKKMICTKGLQYLSFGVMASMIEFLGACFDEDDFFETKRSDQRFRAAVDKLDAFTNYRKYNKKGDKHDLYKNLRCGMAHIGRPGKEVAFTEKRDKAAKDKHLEICKTTDGEVRLVLVCEDLFDDLNKASQELITKMKLCDWTGKRHHESFMNPNLGIQEWLSGEHAPSDLSNPE